MTKKIIYFFFILVFSCSSPSEIKPGKEIKFNKNEKEDILYQRALKNFEEGKVQNSVDILKKIEKDYSYTDYAPKSLLLISYIYYESNELILALENLKKFKELYPANKNYPYAEFLTAISLYEQINVISKDQSPTLLALKQFNIILKNYPNTIYATEAKIRIDLINEQLAGKELYIARYYMKKEKWTSAIFRLQNVIEKYSKTIFIDEALHRMVEINYKLGNIENAKKYAAILGYNFNTSEWYKKTYKIVGDKNYNIINQKIKKDFKEKLLSIFSFGK